MITRSFGLKRNITACDKAFKPQSIYKMAKPCSDQNNLSLNDLSAVARDRVFVTIQTATIHNSRSLFPLSDTFIICRHCLYI